MKNGSLATLISSSFSGIGISIANLHTDSNNSDKRPYGPILVGVNRDSSGSYTICIIDS